MHMPIMYCTQGSRAGAAVEAEAWMSSETLKRLGAAVFRECRSLGVLNVWKPREGKDYILHAQAAKGVRLQLPLEL